MANATRVADVSRGWFVGSYAGTTAAQNIHIGFKPAFIIAWNRTDGDTIWFWSKASLTTQVSVVLAAATNTATITIVDNGTVLGFGLPADAVINENAKTYDFLALPDA